MDWIRSVVLGGWLLGALNGGLVTDAGAAPASPKPPTRLAIASKGRTQAVVYVSADAGRWERKAAEDLAHYIGRISGGYPILIATNDPAVVRSLPPSRPRLVVGALALRMRPELRAKLDRAAKKNPILRADAVVLRRIGNAVLLAGNNDDSHYYAVATLLRQWGCRWYLPTDFGECVPRMDRLEIGALDIAYGSPFEVRRYWISWNGDTSGKPEFMHRNFFNEVLVPSGHNLAQFTADLVPPGKTVFQVPIADDSTAEHVAKKVLPTFSAGKDVQLGMEDGVYESDSPLDKQLLALRFDKYFLKPSATDAFLTFYNKVARRLMGAAPQSNAKIGFLAYANITLPPVQVKTAEKPLVAYLAPIDIDPIHPMDSPLSAPKREYRDMVFEWAKVMDGRVVIYDYDQGMMVWRDIPAPSLQAFQHDVREYARAGILGVDTESRGAFATTFTNLHYRGQLLWNPDADVVAMENRFYKDFYGPAAGAMQRYWSGIYQAWTETIATEHEIHLFPAVYTSNLIQQLASELNQAERKVEPLVRKVKRTDRENQWVARMRFQRLCFDLLDSYFQMTKAASVDGYYDAAVVHGDRGLGVREELTRMSGIFTTYKTIGESGTAWWPGEVEQFKRLSSLTNGTQGTRVVGLPHAWLFRTDPTGSGVASGWAKSPIEIAPWDGTPLDWRDVRDNRDDWQWVLSSVYLQAQGLITDDHQAWNGIGWYRVDVNLDPATVAKSIRMMFPGLFNQATLYVNGRRVAERTGYQTVWWNNDYAFEWDVDVTGALRPGRNTIALRIDNPHHMGGMFRRPFLYSPTAPTKASAP